VICGVAMQWYYSILSAQYALYSGRHIDLADRQNDKKKFNVGCNGKKKFKQKQILHTLEAIKYTPQCLLPHGVRLGFNYCPECIFK
jgi:hypothetical protein